MANKKYEVIDQMFSAVLSQNESEATIKALRPQVEQAVQALIEERGLPKNFTGVIPYNGFKIRVQRSMSSVSGTGSWIPSTLPHGTSTNIGKENR